MNAPQSIDEYVNEHSAQLLGAVKDLLRGHPAVTVPCENNRMILLMIVPEDRIMGLFKALGLQCEYRSIDSLSDTTH